VKRSAVVAATLGSLVLVSLVLAAAALGQDSSVGGYGGLGGEVSAGAGGGGSPASAAGVSGTLPFTGVDLFFAVIAGAAILLVGLALRRFGRARA
jgi:hypothetical protein